MDEKTVDRHSVNCYYCGQLFDERQSLGTTPDGGETCPKCYYFRLDHWSNTDGTKIKIWAEVELINDENNLYEDVCGPICLLETNDLISALLWLDDIEEWGDSEPATLIEMLKKTKEKRDEIYPIR